MPTLLTDRFQHVAVTNKVTHLIKSLSAHCLRLIVQIELASELTRPAATSVISAQFKLHL
jgi:hypothetical protein